METTGKNVLGKISLCLAIAGIIGTVILGLCFSLFAGLTGIMIPISIFVLLFIGLEITALVTGIIAWCSPYGKAGLGVSVLLLLLMIFFVPVFKTVRYEGPRTTVFETIESVPTQSQEY